MITFESPSRSRKRWPSLSLKLTATRRTRYHPLEVQKEFPIRLLLSALKCKKRHERLECGVKSIVLVELCTQVLRLWIDSPRENLCIWKTRTQNPFDWKLCPQQNLKEAGPPFEVYVRLICAKYQYNFWPMVLLHQRKTLASSFATKAGRKS